MLGRAGLPPLRDALAACHLFRTRQPNLVATSAMDARMWETQQQTSYSWLHYDDLAAVPLSGGIQDQPASESMLNPVRARLGQAHCAAPRSGP